MEEVKKENNKRKFLDGEQVWYTSKVTGNGMLVTIEGYDEEQDLYHTDKKSKVPPQQLEPNPPAAAPEECSADHPAVAGTGSPRPDLEAEHQAVAGTGSTGALVAAPAEYSDTGIDAFAVYIMEEFTKLMTEGQSTSRPPWQTLKEKYVPNLEQLDSLLGKARAMLPFSKEQGVNYMGFQSATPTRSKGSCHALFLNAFNASSFPQGLYWPDLLLQLQEVLAKGSWDETLQVYPVPTSLTEASVLPQGSGILQYGADGPYVSGVNLFVASAITCISAMAPPGVNLPSSLLGLSAISVTYTRHTNAESRCLFALRETAAKCALNRALDPFMLITAMKTIGANSEKSVSEVIKRFNKHFWAQKDLQIKGKAAWRIKNLMSEETMPANHSARIRTAIEAHSWNQGPWSDAKFEFEGFYVNKLCKEVSHEGWVLMFTASVESQNLAIAWNHRKFETGQDCDAPAFHAMIKRFVFAVNIAKHILAPATVNEGLIQSFLSDVSGGMHQATLDSIMAGNLPENFMIKRAREWSRSALPFCETIIAQQVSDHLGLTVDERRKIEARESAQVQNAWKNNLMKDVSDYMSTMEGFHSGSGAYSEAERKHRVEVDENARRAVYSFLFGGQPGDVEGLEHNQKPALMEFEVHSAEKYGEAMLGKISGFVRRCLAHPTAARLGITEQDVAIAVIADFSSMGSLKDSVLRQVATFHSNLMSSSFAAYTVVIYPEKPRGYSQCVLSPKEKAAQLPTETDADGDPDMLVDDEAVLPSVEVASETKKSYTQKRAALTKDVSDVLNVLGNMNLDSWYPETFTMSFVGADKQGRRGFVAMPVEGGEWITCKLARGGFHDLPQNDAFIKVSRTEARRARAEKSVVRIQPKKASSDYAWQKGAKAERIMLEDILGGAKNKNMVVFIDLFAAVGDRAAGFYDMVKDRGADARPMTFFYAVDPREHFVTVAKMRTLEEASNDFNKEKLSIPGFVPLPARPPAWEGKAPDLLRTVQTLRQSLKVAGITDKGELLIPKDADVPCELTADIRKALEQYRKQFPIPEAEEKAKPEGEGAGATSKKFGSLKELQGQMHVVKSITQATVNFLIVSSNKDQCDPEFLELWAHNPSTTRRASIDAGTFVVGLEGCVIRQESDANLDKMVPCTVRWSFNKPGSKEQLQDGEKDVSADAAFIYTIPKGDSELKYMSVANALKSFGAYPTGTVYGFKTMVTSTKQVMLKQAEVLYVTPKAVAIPDASIHNAGFFIGLQAAAAPETKLDLLRPILVVYNPGKKATLEPKQQSCAIRFNAAKNISIGIDGCVRLW